MRRSVSRSSVVLSLVALVALSVACDTPSEPDPQAGDPVAEPLFFRVPPATQAELGAVRAATAKYQDVSRAIADGYVDINVVLPGQGRHFLNESRLTDGVFDATQPELLLYAPRGNRVKLVGVEYAVPLTASASAPSGFTGDADQWHVESGFGIWALHAWVWLGNPTGIFADANPNVR